MRQAITTKFLPVTNSRGSRIKAIARKRSSFGAEMAHTQSYQHGGTEVEHCSAAKACAEKYGWSGLWVGGGNADEDGFVFVNLNRPHLPFNGSKVKMSYVGGELAGVEGRDWFYVERKGA